MIFFLYIKNFRLRIPNGKLEKGGLQVSEAKVKLKENQNPNPQFQKDQIQKVRS